ncbi:DUF6024 family protein [Streptomyces chattanoogensis]|uniref:Aminotransferase class V domain-containing protein n=1 Tax=Streptomyces chattanoogensis TaxID=66876 RepID=A0A0N0Y1D1_9ACTN|nr:DUF6024 family protein [Streptomyces chattanoogensis]KPC66505.1 hypothetical protein ADL29_03435 [Streptomyces chattanoogensis]
MGTLDAAALHPGLQPPGLTRHYFAEAAALRTSVADRLVHQLGPKAGKFTLYLLHNTTSGLLAVLAAASASGHAVRTCGPDHQHYPAYAQILPRGGADAEWELRTHVSPLTGTVDDLAGSAIRIVDAAQSLGTALTAAALARGDVVLAPLHKHLGLAVGLGLVLVRNDRPELEHLHRVLRVAESGAQSLDLLRTAQRALREAEGRIFNRAVIDPDDRLRTWCAERGMRLLNHGHGVPFACVTPVDGTAVTDRLASSGWRHFRPRNIARFAFHRPGLVDDPPADHTPMFQEALTHALRDG